MAALPSQITMVGALGLGNLLAMFRRSPWTEVQNLASPGDPAQHFLRSHGYIRILAMLHQIFKDVVYFRGNGNRSLPLQ